MVGQERGDTRVRPSGDIVDHCNQIGSYILSGNGSDTKVRSSLPLISMLDRWVSNKRPERSTNKENEILINL